MPVSPVTVQTKASLSAGPSKSPVEIVQAMRLEKLVRIGLAAAGQVSVEAAIVVRDQLPVVEIDRPPLFETYIIRDGDQVRLVLHGAERIGIEVDEQLFSFESSFPKAW